MNSLFVVVPSDKGHPTGGSNQTLIISHANESILSCKLNFFTESMLAYAVLLFSMWQVCLFSSDMVIPEPCPSKRMQKLPSSVPVPVPVKSNLN